MRFNPDSDAKFYLEERNNWDEYCRYPSEKSWARRKAWEKPQTMNVYSDLDGKEIPFVQDKDLYFKDRPKTRRKDNWRLPIYYSAGDRFIKVSQHNPKCFRCSPAPMNLHEVRAVNEAMRIRKVLKDHEKWLTGWNLYECYKKKEFFRSPK